MVRVEDISYLLYSDILNLNSNGLTFKFGAAFMAKLVTL